MDAGGHPDLGRWRACDTRLDITDWYTGPVTGLAAAAKKAGRKGDGRGAAFSAYQVVSSILNAAVDHELIEVSPAKVKRALQYVAVHEPVVLTAEQMWQLHELQRDRRDEDQGVRA